MGVQPCQQQQVSHDLPGTDTPTALCARNAILLLQTEQSWPVPLLGIVPVIPDTGNSLHNLSFPVTQAITLSHCQACLLNYIIRLGGGSRVPRREYSIHSLSPPSDERHGQCWLFPCLKKLHCGQTRHAALQHTQSDLEHCKFQKSHLSVKASCMRSQIARSTSNWWILKG